MSESKKEKCLRKFDESETRYRCSTTLLERENRTSSKFTECGQISFVRDSSGWYEHAKMISGNHIYTMEDYDCDYKITINTPDGTREIELPRYMLADIFSLFQIMEKMRKKIGVNKACSDKKITKIKATKTKIEEI